MDRTTVTITTIILVPVLLVAILVVVVIAPPPPQAAGLCGPAGGDAASVSAEGRVIGDWTEEQTANAAAIMNAAADLGLSERDQIIGVMVAMGESTLQVLDYGDDVGPDSRGLFQQRDNGAWGTYEDRMDPHTSATNFFRALAQIEDRESMALTLAGHRVQGNANPHHYAAYEQAARTLVAAIKGEDDGSFTISGNTGGCIPVSAEGIPDQTLHGQPSTHLACPEGSTDLGVHDGAYQGNRIPIRLCSITGTVCTGSDCRAGSLGGIARGEVVMNAQYAPYFMAWIAAVRGAGYDPTFSSSFRSWSTQARISGGGSNSNAATNGNSHHQAGAAVDASGLPGSYNKNRCTGKTPDGGCMTSGDLWRVLHQLGLAHGITVHDQEFWHFEFILSGEHRGRSNPFLQ